MATNFPQMVWDQGEVGERLKLFKSKMYLACEDNDITDPKIIARKIKIGLGDEGLLKLETSGLSSEEQDDPDELWRYFEDQLVGKMNLRLQRLILMRMKQGGRESVDSFVDRVRIQAFKCGFKKDNLNERMIEVIIAGTALETYREELLECDESLTLDECVKIGRRHEGCMKAATKMNTESQPKNEETARFIKTCIYCAGSHYIGKCPAYKVICNKCDRRGHYAHLCRSRGVNADQTASQNTGMNINLTQTQNPGPSMEDVLEKVVDKIAQPKVVHTVVKVTPSGEKQQQKPQGKKKSGGGGRGNRKAEDGGGGGNKTGEDGGGGKDAKGKNRPNKQQGKSKKTGQDNEKE